jgi:RNA polymerase sigma-70 factor (ECF subfamily)
MSQPVDIPPATIPGKAAQHATPPPPPPTTEADEELRLLDALRQGDEAAFMRVVDRYHGRMVRLALVYVGDQDVAEEVAQEAWLGVLRGLPRFEARSSLRTWIFHIVVNRAKTRAGREGRSIPFSALWEETDADEPMEDPAQFLPADHPRWPGHWVSFPRSWEQVPEERLLAIETLAYIGEAIEGLPPNQRMVITLRDVEGLPSDEICNVLGISETNQRVLLHRARTQVRRALAHYLVGDESPI